MPKVCQICMYSVSNHVHRFGPWIRVCHVAGMMSPILCVIRWRQVWNSLLLVHVISISVVVSFLRHLSWGNPTACISCLKELLLNAGQAGSRFVATFLSCWQRGCLGPSSNILFVNKMSTVCRPYVRSSSGVCRAQANHMMSTKCQHKSISPGLRFQIVGALLWMKFEFVRSMADRCGLSDKLLVRLMSSVCLDFLGFILDWLD